MTGWHHRLNGREFEWTPGVGDGQGGLVCCSPWGHKESDTAERLNWTFIYRSHSSLYYYTVSPVPSIGGGLRVEQSYGLSSLHAENLFPHETVSPMWAGAIAIWISLCSQCWGGTFGVWAMCYHRYIKTRIQRTRRNRRYDSESMPSMRPNLLIRKCAHDPGQHPRYRDGHLISSEPISPLSSLKEPSLFEERISRFSKRKGWNISFPLWIQALRMKAWSYLRVFSPAWRKLTWSRSKMTTHRRCWEEKWEV